MATNTISVAVPAGMAPGQTFIAQAPDGRQAQVTIPAGVQPGQLLSVELPPLVTPMVVQGMAWTPPPAEEGGTEPLAVEGGDGGDDVEPIKGETAGSAHLQYFPEAVLVGLPVGPAGTPTVTGLPVGFLPTQLPVEGTAALIPVSEAPPRSEAATESLSDFTGSTSGIQSFDPGLCTVPELTRFFQTHNGRPSLTVHVHGYHQVRRTSGSGKNRKTRTHTVTDFRYHFDLTELVSPFGYIQATPDAQGDRRTLPQVLKEYIASTNVLKEIRMMKHVTGFDFVHVRQGISARIRQLGFRRRLSVGFSIAPNCVKVLTPTWQAQCANSPVVKCLCCVTCLCIIGLPLRNAMRDLKESVHSNFPATTSAQTWLAANLHRLHCSRGNPNPIHGPGAWDPSRQIAQPSFPAMRPAVATGWGAQGGAVPAQGIPLDTNGDGVADSVGFDTTGDGQVDTVQPMQMGR